MKKRIISILLSSAMILSLASCGSQGTPSSSSATANNSSSSGSDGKPTIEALDLLSGAATGSWYTIGAGLADKFNDNYEGFPMTTIPGPGSIGNIPVIASGDSEIGMSYGPFLIAAQNGEAPFETAYTNLRSICVLQPTVIQPITTLDIDTLGEFIDGKMKESVGVYPVGNASTFIIETILKQYGLSGIDAIEEWGAKPYYADGSSLADAWADRHIVLQMPMLNVPASGVTEALVTRSDGHLISLDQEIIDKLVTENGFSPYTIKAGTYEGQTEDCQTVGLPIVVFTTENVDEEIIYNFTKSIYENKEYFEGVHSSFAEFDPQTMNEGVAIELHPGAEKFYKEVGLM